MQHLAAHRGEKRPARAPEPARADDDETGALRSHYQGATGRAADQAPVHPQTVKSRISEHAVEDLAPTPSRSPTLMYIQGRRSQRRDPPRMNHIEVGIAGTRLGGGPRERVTGRS